MDNIIVTSSPHIRANDTTRRVMLDVCIALMPAAVAAVWFFGWYALALIAASTITAVLAEAITQRLMHRTVTISDCSAIVTGLLVAYNVPASAPLWLPMIGSAFAIIIVKQFFGGIGKNFMNPALAARAVMLASWMSLMTGSAFTAPVTYAADAYTGATALASADTSTYSLWQLFIGDIPGCLGEVSKLALLIGAAYLLIRKVISWRIPVAMLGTAFICFLINSGSIYSMETGSALYQLLSGGMILGAFFMATDYSSSPVTPLGQLIFGAGCGFMLFIIRAFNPTYPEGCSYAILFMNLLVPLIDRYTAPRVYGRVKKNA
ncbi:MAG: RnfABCDGE type electron transport complex subunit D [Candidatus Fimadaptatus sp.]|jgi:electron transport complex protein RnfD